MTTSWSSRDEFFNHLDSLDGEVDADEKLSPPCKRRKTEGVAVVDFVTQHPVATAAFDEFVDRDNTRNTLVPYEHLNNRHSSQKNANAEHQRGSSKSDASRSKAKSNNEVAERLGYGLFVGMTFYFIPNDSIAKLRKLRIQSAVSQGATWARKLNEEITHVIVDAGIPAESAAKAMKGQINFDTISIVKDKWLIECLTYKALRDPTQPRFQLKGAVSIFCKSAKSTNASHKQLQRLGLNPDDVANPATDHDISSGVDDLSRILQEMKTCDYLPFDEEMDLDNFVSFGGENDNANQEKSKWATPEMRLRKNKGFICMEPNTGYSDNPNNRTIDILQQMATYYDRTGDNWRTLAYRKAISALRKQTVLITTKEQAQAIFGIGTRLAEKIEEIVTTDRLRRLDSVVSDPTDQVLQLFMGIYGCGIRQARTWIEQGYRTLKDLRDNATLTINQQIGVDHYDDFQQRIPRHEVKRHVEIVQRALTYVDRDLQAIIGGSYRRGMSDSGDIDILITHPNAELKQLREWVFNIAIPNLFDSGFMKCTLATSRSSEKELRACSSPEQLRTKPTNFSQTHSKPSAVTSKHMCSLNSGTKFHGASSLGTSTPWRRIDLLLVPANSLGASLIYFTGNDIFNRSLRLLASRKGMRLNQHGLYKNALRGPGRVKETEGELVEGRSERRIFEILGVPWRRPEERRC